MDDIRSISREDPAYPESLKNISDAPRALYFLGKFVEKDEILFGVVGTRRPSTYGQQAAIGITRDLSAAGLTIVSGMAPGIDTFAHAICVENSRRTIGVLGTGLDEKSIYPQQNLPLARNIIAKGGCLISEFPPGTHGSQFTFPKRNRIISALSEGILVVEAKEKSGSLITAEYARKHRKKIFAVPGQISTANAKGPNQLIKNGAMLVESAEDILKELGVSPQKILQKELFAENNEETLILQALTEGALYIDTIIEKTHLNASVIGSTLALMEISGKIRNLGGNIYSIN